MMNTTENAALPECVPHLATSEILLHKLLVAVDFSDQSSRALQEAITISRCFGSEILLVHAVTSTVYGAGMEPVPIAPFEMGLEVATARMADLIHNETAFKEIHHREFVAYAGAIDLVQRVAEENKVDLVVAGSRGAGGLKLLALGSVAESILKVVSCPVLIVGPHCHQESHPFRSILFATDLDPTGLRSAQFATSFAERFRAKLTLLHVIDKKSRRSGVQPELVEDNIRKELARLLPADLSTYTSADIRVEHGKAGDIIPSTASALGASLIVIGFGRHCALSHHSPSSTLSQVIREAPCPVLSVRSHFV